MVLEEYHLGVDGQPEDKSEKWPDTQENEETTVRKLLM